MSLLLKRSQKVYAHLRRLHSGFASPWFVLLHNDPLCTRILRCFQDCWDILNAVADWPKSETLIALLCIGVRLNADQLIHLSRFSLALHHEVLQVHYWSPA